MSIQPGVGLSFSASSSGTTLDINPVWSNLVGNTPSNVIPDGGGEVEIPTGSNDAVFSKLRVICRSADNSHLSCLREYNLVGMAVYPTGSKTAPATANTDLIDDGATFTLVPPVSPSTSKSYAFCVILNHYNVYSGVLSAGVPYAALMEVGGDGYNKTNPWRGENHCDLQTWVTAFNYVPVTIDVPDPPYEIDGNLEIQQLFKLKNYNCQRVRVATISWNSTTTSWVVTQHLVGPITIPFNIFYEGPYRYEDDGFTPPSWWTTPDYATEQANWEGAFSDCTKWSGGLNPSQVVTL